MFYYAVRLIPDALNMPDEKFENLFGIEKPDEDAELIFTCYIGKRSFVAREIAKSLGFSRWVKLSVSHSRMWI